MTLVFGSALSPEDDKWQNADVTCDLIVLPARAEGTGGGAVG